MRNRNIGVYGAVALAAGAVLVGVAIVLEGDAGRMVNGMGGVLWFASTALLTLAATRTRAPYWLWGVLAVVTITVAFVVKPSAVLPTLIGFIPAGFVMAAAARRDMVLWALLVPAWYLPAHIGTAGGRSLVRSMLGNDAPLRTDPPPTAAFVPELMVICAVAGGYLAARLLDRIHGPGVRRSWRARFGER